MLWRKSKFVYHTTYIKYHSLLLCLSCFRAQTERQMLFDLQNSPSDYLEYRFDGQTGATPLHVAAANGYLSVVEYLVGRRFVVIIPRTN